MRFKEAAAAATWTNFDSVTFTTFGALAAVGVFFFVAV